MMMKLDGKLHCTKSRLSSNFRVIGPILGVLAPKMWQFNHLAKDKQTDERGLDTMHN